MKGRAVIIIIFIMSLNFISQENCSAQKKVILFQLYFTTKTKYVDKIQLVLYCTCLSSDYYFHIYLGNNDTKT